MTHLSEIGLLINLARADGEVSVEEAEYLISIGKANNISEEQILTMLQKQHKEIIHDEMTPEDRLDLLVKLVQLMKCDGKLYKQELQYCARIAAKLGFDEILLFDLLLNVSTGKISAENIVDIKKKARLFSHF